MDEKKKDIVKERKKELQTICIKDCLFVVRVTSKDRTLSFIAIHPFYYFVLAFRYFKMDLPSDSLPKPIQQINVHFRLQYTLIPVYLRNLTLLLKTSFQKATLQYSLVEDNIRLFMVKGTVLERVWRHFV